MRVRVAVVGKGGAGKSMIAGSIARILARRGHPVLALGTDVMPGLTHSLGAGADSEPSLSEAVEQEGRRWRLKKGVGAVRAVQRYSTRAPDGVRLLHCGTPTDRDFRPVRASLGAFAHVVGRLEEAKTFRDWTLVGDLAAGPEPAALNWAPYADTWLVVVEPTWKSVLTARRIARITRARPGKSTLFVVNKAADEDLHSAEEMLGEPVFAAIPADRAVIEADLAGVAPIDHAPSSPAMIAIEGMADVLERGSIPEVRRP
jgi:CO dehydrogenase maturation factor